MKIGAGFCLAAVVTCFVCWLVRRRKATRGQPAKQFPAARLVATPPTWTWSRPLTFLLSWSPSFMTPYVAVPARTHRLWPKSQVIVATRDGDDIVLDCLVPVLRSSDGGRGAASVPMTLRTHQLPSRQPVDQVDAAMARWTTTSAFVDIVVDQEEGCAVVSIRNETSAITLELMASSPTG